MKRGRIMVKYRFLLDFKWPLLSHPLRLSLIALLLIVANGPDAVRCDNFENEFYSSIAGLESLLKTEHILLTDLKDYIETTKQQINVLEK